MKYKNIIEEEVSVMKLLKLLLIGFLSSVSLLACGDDTIAPTSPKLKIVAEIDNGTPEFYADTTVMLKTVDANGNIIKSTWSTEDTAGVELSDNLATGVTSETVKVKVTDIASAKGVITAKINIDGVISTANLIIIPSEIALKSITISPVDPVIKLVKNKGKVTLTALATFENNRFVDATNDIVWSMPTTSNITIDHVTGIVTATAVITSPAIATGTFTSKTVERSNTTSITAVQDTVAKITVTVDNNGTLKLPNGAEKQLKAMATYIGGSTDDITDEVTWSTSDASVVSIDRSTKGVINGVKASGTAKISAESSNGKIGEITITGSPSELKSITITQNPITTIDAQTPTIVANNSDTSQESSIDATDFKWTLTLVGGGDAKDIAEINTTTGVITAKSGVASNVVIEAVLNDNKQPINLPIVIVEPITVKITTQ